MYIIILILVALLVAFALIVFLNNKLLINYHNYFWGTIISSFVGGLLGELILGDWGIALAGFNVIAGIIGALVLAVFYLVLATRN